MDLKDLVRDAKKVVANLKKLDNGTVMTLQGCSIYIPARYRDKQLATIGADIYVLGIFMLVYGKHYAVNNIMAMVRISPDRISETKFGGADYIRFDFDPGSIVFANTQVVVDDDLPFDVYDEIISKGNVPEFFGYNDLLNLFQKSSKYNGVPFTSTPTIQHMVFSRICRVKGDLNKHFRQIADGKDESKLDFISLTSPTHGATNAATRLQSAHFTDNLTGSLINTTDKEQDMEHILRM